MATLPRDMEYKRKIFQSFSEKLHRNISSLQKSVSLQFSDYLKEPVKEELPRLHVIGVGDFYRGAYFDHDYRPLPEFSRQRESLKGELIELHDVFKPTLENVYEEWRGTSGPQRKSKEFKHSMLLGPAGSGKTTALKRFGRECVNGYIPQMQDRNYIFHWLSCRSFDKNEQLTVPEFLFRYMLDQLTADECRIGYEFMLQNSKTLTMIIDSLDTLAFELENVTQLIGPYDQAPPAVILYNIFIGNIFSELKILSSSREYKVRKYKGDLQPDRMISLGGFTIDSIHNLAFGFLEEADAERIWDILNNKCPDLLALCETPAVLTFTLVGLSETEDSSFIPHTMTGILVRVLQSLIRSKHARALGKHDAEYVIGAINKMKVLSYQGTMEGKVLFNDKDINEAQLTTEEITDLAIVVPGQSPEPRYQQILEKDSKAMFVHQVIQELLTAMQICLKQIDDFKEFVSKFLHEPAFSVIRRILCGILLNPEVHEEAMMDLLQVTGKVSDLQTILTSSMADKMKKFSEPNNGDELEMIRSIHEAGNGLRSIVPANLDKINLDDIHLLTSDMHALASTLFYCSNVGELSLWGCNLTAESLKAFNRRLLDSYVKINKLNARLNKKMGVSGFASLGNLVRKREIQDVGLAECDLTSEEIDAFNKELGDATINKLSAAGNQEMGVSAFASLGNLVRKRETQDLSLAGCDLTSEEIDAFNKELGDATMNLLDVTFNQSMQTLCLTSIGNTATSSALHILVLVNCNLTATLLRALDKGLYGSKLDLLDVSDNHLGTEEMDVLGILMANHGVKGIGITDCELKAEEGRSFRNAVGDFKVTEIKNTEEVMYFDTEYISGVDPQTQAIVEILPIVSECVDMTGRDLPENDMKLLQDTLDGLCTTCPRIKYGAHGQRILCSREAKKQPTTEALAGTGEHFVVSRTEQHEVGEEGKEIRIANNILTFHPGTFNTTTSVLVKLEIDSSKWPKGYIGITPMLFVKAENVLLHPATVRIVSWCMNDGSKESRSATVDVLHLPYGESQWEVIRNMAFTEETEFQFDCNDFSPIIVGLPEKSRGSEIYRIKGFILSNRITHNIVFAFFLQNQIVEDEIFRQSERRGLTYEIEFNTQSVKLNDNIKAEITCLDQGFKFNGDRSCFFVIDEDFIMFENIERYHFPLTCDEEQGYSLVRIKCLLQKNGKIVDKYQAFNYPWSKRFPAASTQEQINTEDRGAARTVPANLEQRLEQSITYNINVDKIHAGQVALAGGLKNTVAGGTSTNAGGQSRPLALEPGRSNNSTIRSLTGGPDQPSTSGLSQSPVTNLTSANPSSGIVHGSTPIPMGQIPTPGLPQASSTNQESAQRPMDQPSTSDLPRVSSTNLGIRNPTDSSVVPSDATSQGSSSSSGASDRRQPLRKISPKDEARRSEK